MESTLEDEDEASTEQVRAETVEKPSPEGTGESLKTTCSLQRLLLT